MWYSCALHCYHVACGIVVPCIAINCTWYSCALHCYQTACGTAVPCIAEVQGIGALVLGRVRLMTAVAALAKQVAAGPLAPLPTLHW